MNPGPLERIRDWLLLIILLAISLFTMLFRNDPLLRGLRAVSLEATSSVEHTFSWFADYLRALEENNRLREENIRLSSEVARSREAQILNAKLSEFLALQDSSASPLVAARIISKDPTRQQNYLILDVGSRDGIQVGMAVIDTRGILGKIVLVSDHYCSVMTYLNTDFIVPAKVQPLQLDGLVKWEGERQEYLLLQHIVKTEPIERGQRVVTSGYSNVFPPGYPIGLVDSIAVLPGRNELLIFLRPTANLEDAEYAFVIQALQDSALQALREY